MEFLCAYCLIACTVSLAIGYFLLSSILIDDIKGDLRELNKNVKIKTLNRSHGLKQLNDFIKFHMSIKELRAIFIHVNSKINE